MIEFVALIGLNFSDATFSRKTIERRERRRMSLARRIYESRLVRRYAAGAS